MPNWRLANKLNPAKKAWKSFTAKVQPKIRKFLKHSVPNTFKAVTKCIAISFNSFLPTKFRSISIPRRSPYSHHESPTYFNTTQQNYNQIYSNNGQQLYHKSFSAVHIDELFEPEMLHNNKIMHGHDKNPGTSHTRDNNNIKGKRVGDQQDLDHDDEDRKGNWGRSKSAMYSVEDAWKAVVAASPQLRCVDERANEFIFKVRNDIKLQKDKSDLEFQEMLARGA